MTPCQAQVAMDCTGRAVHVHHRKRRSQGGDDSETNLLSVCLACHDWIHAHPNAAYEKGLLVRSWQEPAEVPLNAAACSPTGGSLPGGSVERCKRCKGSGSEPKKPKKLEKPRKRVMLGIRVPKDAEENGVEMLETLLAVARKELAPEMGWKDDVPPYYVLTAVLYDWITLRAQR